jgi:hypothetical protein
LAGQHDCGHGVRWRKCTKVAAEEITVSGGAANPESADRRGEDQERDRT